MAKKVFKNVFTFTILSPDTPIDPNISYDALIDSFVNGDCLGEGVRTSSEELPSGKIEEESIKLGNDGTFFACFECGQIGDKCDCT